MNFSAIKKLLAITSQELFCSMIVILTSGAVLESGQPFREVHAGSTA